MQEGRSLRLILWLDKFSRPALLAIAVSASGAVALLLYLVVRGSTAKDSITAGVALYGAIIATLNELRTASAKARAMRFDCLVKTHPRDNRVGTLYLRFTNVAERPATVDGIAVTASGKDDTRMSMDLDANLGKSERRLADGDSITGTVSANEVGRCLRALGWSGKVDIRPVCFLSDGTKWDAGPLEFNCDEWPDVPTPPPLQFIG
jgi:hypothetical protein